MVVRQPYSKGGGSCGFPIMANRSEGFETLRYKRKELRLCFIQDEKKALGLTLGCYGITRGLGDVVFLKKYGVEVFRGIAPRKNAKQKSMVRTSLPRVGLPTVWL
jgi:hypothetical protein